MMAQGSAAKRATKTQAEGCAAHVVAPEGAFEQTMCPACGEERGASVFEEVCEGVRVELMECARCAMVYSNPRPSERYKIERYASWATQERPWSAEAHYDHRQQLRHFHLYRKVMQVIQERTPRGRILDVGCGGGLFVVFAGVYSSEHNTGVNSAYQAEGAAFDPQEAELAKKISGAPVHMISELGNLPTESYDAITLLNVLEHVNRPVEMLTELRRLLKPGGGLVIVVPNNELALLRLRHGIGMRPESFAAHEHINHFRKGPLRTLLKKTGFERMRLLPGQAVGGSGSIVAIPMRQWMKHGVYRAMDAVSAGRVYWYAELTVVAE